MFCFFVLAPIISLYRLAVDSTLDESRVGQRVMGVGGTMHAIQQNSDVMRCDVMHTNLYWWISCTSA
jgi:hypothetical protein